MIVYVAVCRHNQKAYVGQTRGTFSKRHSGHTNTVRQAFHLAIRKYGRESFDWAVLEKCDSLEALNEAEKKWISRLGSVSPVGYNVAHGGGGTLGVKASAETKRKLSQSHIGKPSWNTGMKMGPEWMNDERKKQLSASHQKRIASGVKHPSLGRVQSGEERQMRSVRNQGINKGESNGMHGKTGELHPMYGKHHSEESNKKNSDAHLELCQDPAYRAKLSAAHKGKPWTEAQRNARMNKS